MFTVIGVSVPMVRSEYLTDRELSWLSFNERVLELAEDSDVPLLERVRFLAIFASNLDEFFMVRVATLKSKIDSGIKTRNLAGLTPIELMEKISQETRVLIDRQTKCLHEELLPDMAAAGICLVKWDELHEDERHYVTALFNERIFPVLTPLAVDPSRPFPYISGLSLNLAVIVKNSFTKEEFFARVKVPPILSRFVETSAAGNKRFIPLEELIAANLSVLFPGMEIVDHYTFRVTRNQDLELDEEETEDLLSSLEQELLRRRFGPPVRLEIEAGIKPEQLKRLADELDIDEDGIISSANPLDLTGLNQLVALDLPSLKYPALKSRTAPGLATVNSEESDSFFSALRQGEILLHHPYESFTNSVVQFLDNAAQDPMVLAIKQTLYRTSGDSSIMDALIEAAEAGKQVLAVIEIRARFDEQANVRWARKLEAAGAHVVYGLMGFKTHAKLSLVVRDEPDGLRRYCHIGTGNYNPKTARYYEDIGLLSADPVLTEDLTKLFNQLSGFAPHSEYSRVLVAPRSLRKELLAKIEREIHHHKAGRRSGIQFKLNSLLDEEFVESLYRASSQGVPIELLIRGICSLRPGIPGLSERIKVRAILGRFLEHSRIFHFVNDGDDEYWIGSADLMHRNLDRRVESLVRIDRDQHKRSLQNILDFGMSDQVVSWHLEGSDWTRFTKTYENEKLVDFQEAMIQLYQRGK
jgi:polyphosphate kinase